MRLLLAATFLLSACDSAIDGLKAIPGAGGNAPGVKRKSTESGDLFGDDGVSTGNRDKDDGDDGFDDEDDDPDGDSDATSSDIVFPQLDFSGRGNSTCDGETYSSTAGIITTIDNAALDINLHRNYVNVGGKGQDKADEKLAKSVGHTIYDRSSKDKLAADDFENARYVIFSDRVNKQAQGQVYNFDKPLPVYPWPAPESRYDDLDDGPMSWTANITGHRSFTATVTVSKVSTSADRIELKILLDIHGDSNRALYEDFPVPREAVYTINTKERDIRRISTTNWFFGDENCDGKQEHVKMTYSLCKKTTGSDVETVPCG